MYDTSRRQRGECLYALEMPQAIYNVTIRCPSLRRKCISEKKHTGLRIRMGDSNTPLGKSASFSINSDLKEKAVIPHYFTSRFNQLIHDVIYTFYLLLTWNISPNLSPPAFVKTVQGFREDQ